MNCDYFRVLYNDIVLADHMTLENALLFVKALFEKFWQEPGLKPFESHSPLSISRPSNRIIREINIR